LPLMSVRLSHRLCRVCQGPMTVHEETRGGVCSRDSCRKTDLVQEVARRHREVAETRRQLSLEHREKVAGSLGFSPPDSLSVAVVPATSRPVVRLPHRRRRQFLSHLARVIREAAGELQSAQAGELPEEERAGAAQFVPELPVTRAACSACRGFCCRLGGTHAFVDAVTIRRYLASRPGMLPRDVLHAYRSRLPARGAQYSCVYHGENGCTLPREMRAHICNTFHCAELLELMKSAARPDAPPILIAAVHESGTVRSRLFAPGDARGPVQPATARP
jgi:hypothetical protein